MQIFDASIEKNAFLDLGVFKITNSKCFGMTKGAAKVHINAYVNGGPK